MRILVIGGTVFVGRELVESALRRGHTVTLFNRGKHNPELFPEVEKLRGERDGGLGPLEGRNFDAVVDFDELVRDRNRPVRLKQEFDPGDHIHPNDTGNQAMADVFDLSLFEK